MKLITITPDAIVIGQALPYSLRDQSGALLASKGFVVEKQEDLDLMVAQRGQLYIDSNEPGSTHRSYVGRLHSMLREDRSLGQIAEAQIKSSDAIGRREADLTAEPDWLELQMQTQVMLRDNNPATFMPRLDKLQATLNRHTLNNPDGTLLALVYLSSTELKRYSATHAMLVSVMCSVAAREVLKWRPEPQATLSKAALTMNLGMTELQDQLALQKSGINPAQRLQVEQHAAHSVQLLTQLGVTDPTWLEAVGAHHTKTPGALSSHTEGQRLARLIQRADMFAALLAPRASRLAESAASAMKACYFDENSQIDETGAALIKAMGIYFPGALVRLATEEVAIVIRRGANTTTPRVAVLLNRSGMPSVELIVRDTSQREFRITSGVPHHDIKVKINLDRLLQLSKLPTGDRY
jgi:HD-GYP domain-containing protein (c-di-GMP phosphodiesterase class II)